jgi:hypothetical protein
MTQGVIVYLLRGEPPEGVEPGSCLQGLSLAGGPLEVVVSRPGILELDDAWHFLLTKGCEPIHLLVTAAEQERLLPLYPLVRLSSVVRVTEEPSGTGGDGRVLH